jgi:hypothetical protein
MKDNWDYAATIATIVAALATTAAVVVALWIAIRDGRARDAERRDAKGAQARLVSLVATKAPGIGNYVGQIIVVNESQGPIRDPIAADDSPDLERGNLTVRDPGRGKVAVPPVITSGATESWFVDIADGDMPASPVDFRAVLFFTDMFGLRWSISPDRQPIQVLDS